MGKISKIIIKITILPFVIIYKLIRWIYNCIYRKCLRKYISNIDINNIDTLNGYEFEELLECLFVCLGFKVTRTKKSRDYGADLIISNKQFSMSLQCKLYYNHNVSNSAIQEVSSARNYYNTDIGGVITNSYFSKPAQNLAIKNNVILFDRNNLIRLLQLTSQSSNKTIHKFLAKEFKIDNQCQLDIN